MNTQKLSLWAGISYLLIIATGITAEMGVRASIKVPDDAQATMMNLIAAESTFRLAVVADLIMIVCDVIVALLFFLLLKPVNSPLASLAAIFRLMQATFLSLNLMHLFSAIALVQPGTVTALGQEVAAAQMMMALNAHALGYSIGLVFFGLSLLVLGYLMIKSTYIPRFLGYVMLIVSAGYLIDSGAQILMTQYADFAHLFALVVFVPALLGELTLAIWLVFRGVSVPDHGRMQAQA